MTSIIASCRGLLLVGSTILALGVAPAWGFGFDEVAERAQRLAREPYVAPVSNLPAEFANMVFADHQQIRFRAEKAYWADEKTYFKLGFHHQGMQFATPVRISELVDGKTIKEGRYDIIEERTRQFLARVKSAAHFLADVKAMEAAIKPDSKHGRCSTVPAPADRAGGPPMA